MFISKSFSNDRILFFAGYLQSLPNCEQKLSCALIARYQRKPMEQDFLTVCDATWVIVPPQVYPTNGHNPLVHSLSVMYAFSPVLHQHDRRMLIVLL